MDNSRMSTADMLQYCNEALAWDDFGPIDIFFFQSVKKILLGQCSAMEEPEEVVDDLMGIERPVRDVELEPEYGLYADIYYGEEGDEDIPDYSATAEDEAFSSAIFAGGFFDEQKPEEGEAPAEEEAGESAPAEEKAPAEEEKAAAKTTKKKPAAKKSAEKKAPAEAAGKKKTASKKKEKAPADKDKHEETSGGGFTVKL